MKISLFCGSVETLFNSRTKVSIVHLMLNAISMKTESSARTRTLCFRLLKSSEDILYTTTTLTATFPCNIQTKIHTSFSRVRGPHGTLWIEFFPSFYGPSAERAGHENKEGKNEDQ